MKDKTKTIIRIVSLTIIMICAYYLGSINFMNINSFNIPLTAYSENNNCYNLSLSETSECLRDELKTFFKYNISQINNELNITQLRESGGVCRHFSQYYKENLINLGFNATTVSFYGEDLGHMITIGYTKNLNNGTWCIFDQTNYKCFELGEINMTEYKELIK